MLNIMARLKERPLFCSMKEYPKKNKLPRRKQRGIETIFI